MATARCSFPTISKNPDAGWGTSDAKVKVGGGEFQITPAINGSWFRFNPPLLFTQADACVTVSIGDLTKPGDMGGGLLFWVQDNVNYYIFIYRADGTWDISRHVTGRWLTVTSGKSDAIKQGANASNELELRLNGNAGEAWINGTKLVVFHGQPPDGGAAFGLYGESEAGRTNTWTFHDFKVLKLP